MLPAAAAIAVILYFGFSAWRDATAPTAIDAAYYVDQHAALTTIAPFAEEAPPNDADVQMMKRASLAALALAAATSSASPPRNPQAIQAATRCSSRRSPRHRTSRMRAL